MTENEEKPAVYYTYEKGEFYSFEKRYTIDTLGNIRGRSNNILKPRDIIFDIQLTDDDDIKRQVRVSRLVLSTFRGNPGPMMQADHIDENKWYDNSLANLQWLTSSENTKKQRPDIRDPISGIPILRVDADGVRTPFVSANSAETLTSVHRGHISRSCRAGGKAGGYDWIYDVSKINQSIIPGEIWKPILRKDGTEYTPSSNIEVSDHNRIRFMTPIMRIYDIPSLSTERDIEKKKRYKLGIQNEKRCVAELVCTTFNGPKPSDCTLVRHINDVYLDCTPQNLRWGTHQDNYADALKNGKTSGIKVVVDDVEFDTAKDAASYLGISFGLLCGIIRREKRTIFTTTDFMKKIYIINDKIFGNYNDASKNYGVCVSTFMKLVKQGDIETREVTMREYKKM
jgi:hypothetical protein